MADSRNDKFMQDLSGPGTVWYDAKGQKIGDLDAMLALKKKTAQKSQDNKSTSADKSKQDK